MQRDKASFDVAINPVGDFVGDYAHCFKGPADMRPGIVVIVCVIGGDDVFLAHALAILDKAAGQIVSHGRQSCSGD